MYTRFRSHCISGMEATRMAGTEKLRPGTPLPDCTSIMRHRDRNGIAGWSRRTPGLGDHECTCQEIQYGNNRKQCPVLRNLCEATKSGSHHHSTGRSFIPSGISPLWRSSGKSSWLTSLCTGFIWCCLSVWTSTFIRQRPTGESHDKRIQPAYSGGCRSKRITCCRTFLWSDQYNQSTDGNCYLWLHAQFYRERRKQIPYRLERRLYPNRCKRQ